MSLNVLLEFFKQPCMLTWSICDKYFFYLRLCRVQNVHFEFLDFKIENYEFSMTLNVDMVYTKVVAFYTIYNIVVDNFLFDIAEEPKYYLVKSI